ncbi:hypothetical protein K474DRAFT_1684027 [Panus rudis PR-1116 ss-1]|nr:hypothetical protein K474DRAFT_1684027 [Panus rudis PR-1116 ss-1]
MSSSNLLKLPVELLYDIFIYAGSESLPLTCRHIYNVFKSAPTSILAEYLYTKIPPSQLLHKGLRYPICTQPVIETMFRNPSIAFHLERSSQRPELPRRLFRTLDSRPRQVGRKRKAPEEQWSIDDEPLPFLRYLYGHPQIRRPDPNAWDGYALTKAVAAGFVPLIQFLTENGADPSCKGAIAVLVAIRKKDISLVKMLIERDGTMSSMEEANERGAIRQRIGVQQQRQGDSSPRKSKTAKRRKLEDRVRVNQEMLKTAVRCNARDIVEYLVHEKGCVPDMQTIRMMTQ